MSADVPVINSGKIPRSRPRHRLLPAGDPLEGAPPAAGAEGPPPAEPRHPALRAGARPPCSSPRAWGWALAFSLTATWKVPAAMVYGVFDLCVA